MDILDSANLRKASGLKGASVAIGVFDGLHLGHESLIHSCVNDASSSGSKSAIVTFDIDPDELFSKEPKKIMTNEQRMRHLSASGVDDVVSVTFDEGTASLEPNCFLDSLFGKNVPASIHVGSDFRFGREKAGDVATLSDWCDRNGVRLYVHELVKKNGGHVKSTRIRKLLEDGMIEDANELLGHPYTICGNVKHGRGEGSSFGIATANIQADCLLKEGVYSGFGEIDSRKYMAAINIGIPPTFEDRSHDNVEVHLLDFQGDLYDKTLCIEFVERLRPLIRFNSTEELIAQITSDIEHVRKSL